MHRLELLGRSLPAACLLAGGFSLGVPEAGYAAGCDPAAPVHIVLMDDFPVATQAQGAEAIAEVRHAVRQAALPGTRTILARPDQTTASLDILVDACLPGARKDGGLLAWFSNPTDKRQEKDRAQLLDTLAGSIETLAVEIGDRPVVKPFGDRVGKLLRRLEREIGAPEKVTLVMSAGPAGPGGAPWGAAPELDLIVLATRHDDGKTLAQTLGRQASVLVIDTGLPPERDGDNCVIGEAPALATAIFVDRTGSLAKGGEWILTQIVRDELARLGADQRLDVYLLDATPVLEAPIQRACRDDRPLEDQARALVTGLIDRIGPPAEWGVGQKSSPLVAQIAAAAHRWSTPAARPDRVVLASDMIDALPLGDGPIDAARLAAIWARHDLAPIDGLFDGITLSWTPLPSVESADQPRPKAFVEALFTLLNANPGN